MQFSMEIPNESTIKNEIIDKTKPESEEVEKLKMAVLKNVDEIMSFDIERFGDKKLILRQLESFGLATMRNSVKKNSILEVSIRSLSKAGSEEGSVAKGLLDLQKEVKDLDPSMIDFTRTGILGMIISPVRTYFAKFQNADTVITSIIKSLEKGQTILKNDNVSLEIEQESMRSLTKKLIKEVEMGSMMDESLALQIEKAERNGESPEKIKFVTEEILFPLRQRLMDMQQMILVNQQGIIAMEVVRRNNLELIRGVERAKTVTISALRTAVIVAGALYNQKIVLKKIELLNKTTSDMILATSKMLKEQGTSIHTQAMETSISVETMKASFEDVISAMNAISTYKTEALPKMRATINQFRELAEKGEEQLRLLEGGNKITSLE